MEVGFEPYKINFPFEVLIVAISAFLIYRKHVSEYEVKFSTFWPRLWAPFIDDLILWPLIGLMPVLLANYLRLEDAIAQLLFAATFLIYYIYSIWLHTAQGATIGKRICKVRVVDAVDERPIKFRQALIRDSVPLVLTGGLVVGGLVNLENGNEFIVLITYLILLLWFFLEVITMLFSEKRRALHDFMAGTVVVRSDLWETERARRREMRRERQFK